MYILTGAGCPGTLVFACIAGGKGGDGGGDGSVGDNEYSSGYSRDGGDALGQALCHTREQLLHALVLVSNLVSRVSNTFVTCIQILEDCVKQFLTPV